MIVMQSRDDVGICRQGAGEEVVLLVLVVFASRTVNFAGTW
jgi:hypothetical protein